MRRSDTRRGVVGSWRWRGWGSREHPSRYSTSCPYYLQLSATPQPLPPTTLTQDVHQLQGAHLRRGPGQRHGGQRAVLWAALGQPRLHQRGREAAQPGEQEEEEEEEQGGRRKRRRRREQEEEEEQGGGAGRRRRSREEEEGQQGAGGGGEREKEAAGGSGVG